MSKPIKPNRAKQLIRWMLYGREPKKSFTEKEANKCKKWWEEKMASKGYVFTYVGPLMEMAHQ